MVWRRMRAKKGNDVVLCSIERFNNSMSKLYCVFNLFRLQPLFEWLYCHIFSTTSHIYKFRKHRKYSFFNKIRQQIFIMIFIGIDF